MLECLKHYFSPSRSFVEMSLTLSGGGGLHSKSLDRFQLIILRDVDQ